MNTANAPMREKHTDCVSNDTGRPLSYALETSFRITWRGILDFLKCPRMLWFGYREALDHAASRIPENMTAGYVFPGDNESIPGPREVPPVIYSLTDIQSPALDIFPEFAGTDRTSRNTLIYAETLRLTSLDRRFEGRVRILDYNDTPVVGISPLDMVPPEDQKTVLKFFIWLMEGHGRICHTGVMYDPLTGLSHLETFSAAEMAEFRHLTARMREVIAGKVPPVIEKCCERCSGCPILEMCDTAGVTPGTDDLETMSPGERRLYVKNDYEKYPLFICTQGSRVSVTGKCLIAHHEEFPDIKKPLSEISMLVTVGGVNLSTPCLKTLANNGIPVIFTTLTGKCCAVSFGTEPGFKNAAALKSQVSVSQDAAKALEISRDLIKAKIRNQIGLIRRISREGQSPEIRKSLIRLNRLCQVSEAAKNSMQLRGIEGEAATVYFDALSLKISETGTELVMNGRNRRPPRDHLNALLSFGYALLLQNVIAAIRAHGLSEWLGILHSERSGKPSLALDLMEEFRTPVVDALIMTIARKKLFLTSDFTEECDDMNEKVFFLNENSRKKFITLFQRRLDTFSTHSYSGKRLSWREIIYHQVGIFLKTLKGELHSYIGMEY